MKRLLLLPKSLLFLCLASSASLHGELPSLPEPQYGTFAHAKEKTLEVVINDKGELIISPLLRNGSTGPYRRIPVLFGIEETQADGKTRVLPFDTKSLQSVQPATDRFKEATITGKVAEGPTFEMTIQQKRGVITIRGKVTDPGPLKEENLRFIASPQILNFYGAERLRLQNDQEAFEELLEDDYVALKLTNGKRKKLDYKESLGGESDEVTSAVIAEVKTKIQIIGNLITFTASKDSSIKLRNSGTPYFYSGFFADWTTQEDDATLTIEVD